jgi:hypothetical protein
MPYNPPQSLIVHNPGQKIKAADETANNSGIAGGLVDTAGNSLSYYRKFLTPSYIWTPNWSMATSSANLTILIPQFEGLVNGKYVTFTSQSVTVTASKDTYYYLTDAGVFSSTAVANGATSPTVPLNTDGSSAMLLPVQISGASAITSNRQVGADSLGNAIAPIRGLVPQNFGSVIGRFRLAATVALTAGTWAPITYGTTEINKSFTVVGNRIYVPYTGIYEVHINNCFSATTSDILAAIDSNNTGASPTGAWVRVGGTGGNPTVQFKRKFSLNANDWINGWCYSTATASILGGASGDTSTLEIEYKGILT